MKTVWDNPKFAAVQPAPAVQSSTQSIGRPCVLLLHIPEELTSRLDAVVYERTLQYFDTQQYTATGQVIRHTNTEEDKEQARTMIAAGQPIAAVNRWMRIQAKLHTQQAKLAGKLAGNTAPSRTSVVMQLLAT